MAKAAAAKKAPKKATARAANAETFTITTPKLAASESWRGVTIGADSKPENHIVLVAVSDGRMTHQEAIDWAKGLGADLAEKNEGALLYANNADGAIPQEWLWLKPLPAGMPGCAWCQYFVSGGQGWSYRDDRLRAVAVRRVSIR